MVKKLDHIGIAVQDLDKALQIYQNILGLSLEEILEAPDRGLKIAFLKTGDVHIELLSPVNSGSELTKFLEKRGEGLHHICFEVDDIKSAAKELQSHSLKSTTSCPTIGAAGQPIIFFHPSDFSGVLVELIEKKH